MIAEIVFLDLPPGTDRAAALALYWTVNNMVSVVQTYRNLQKPVPTLQRIKKKR